MMRLATVVSATLMMALISPLLAASPWDVDSTQSKLGFTATQGGSEFQGGFPSFDATIVFDPDNLADSRFDVAIDVTSISTNSSDRDDIIGDPSWFHFEEFPQATFITREIRTTGEDSYEAIGDLSIRSATQEVILPFTWVIDSDTATMDGDVTLDRMNYNIGTGDWADPSMVGHEVVVHVDLVLQRAD